MSTTKPMNPCEWDVRVRERNLQRGALTTKDIEKMVAQLPDLTDQSEPFDHAQPALSGRDE